MALNKSKGNMYPFVSHTWNPIKGKCLHDCSYCYMKRFKLNDIHLDENEFRVDLGSMNFIFVGSSTDMFAENVPSEWILKVLDYCSKFENVYLFQSKNPARFLEKRLLLPASNIILGTTIETNRHYENIMRNAPTTQERATYMSMINGTKMVTIEPIMDFDDYSLRADNLFDLIEKINPSWVNIGADSKGCGLPEPPKYKIEYLIEKLKKKGYDVRIKSNLYRLMK
jgi:DNA repair photolyase